MYAIGKLHQFDMCIPNGLFLGLAIFFNKALTLSPFLASLYVCFVYPIAKGRDHEIIVRALDSSEGPVPWESQIGIL